MKMKFFILINSCLISLNLFGQNDFRKSLNLNFSYDKKYKFLYGFQDSVFRGRKVNQNNFRINPSISFTNKKGNFWEFRLNGGLFKEDSLETKSVVNQSVGGVLHDSRFVNFLVLNHLDLTKKRNNLKFLLSLKYQIGYNESFLWTHGYDINEKVVTSEIGLTSKVRYRFQNRFFIDFIPPILCNFSTRVGNRNNNLPYIESYKKKLSIIDFDSNILSISRNNYNLYQTNFREFISVGFLF
ncbi:MAG: hypothetical protein LCH67_00305 [Bacteroidetes bacterium]|nr:hypothetical protein [Bacteroidota bacterium]